ncbi:MAG: SpoIIE family protein phosphatase, partial [Candidatus Zixiibacteriota bacterium]
LTAIRYSKRRMFRKPIKETAAEFPAELSALEGMRDVVRRSLAESRLQSREIEQMVLALEEAATNIIRHSYLESGGKIKLTITRYRKRVNISLRDTGRPYYPEEKSDVSLSRLVDTSRKGGLGQMMIQRLMDDVQYIAGDGYNELLMTKLLSPSKLIAAPLRSRAVNLRARFSLATLAIMLLVVGGSYYVMETRVVSGIISKQRESMLTLGESAASLAGAYILNNRTFVEFDELAYSYGTQHSDIRRVTIIDSTNHVLADSREVRRIRTEYSAPLDVASDSALKAQPFVADGEELYYLMIPIISQSAKLGTLALEFGSNSVVEKVAEARTDTFVLIAVELLVGLLLIYLLSNYFVRPIVAITEQVRRFGESADDIASHSANLESAADGAEEFFVISKALNSMMTRLRKDSAERVEREILDREIDFAGDIQKTLLPRERPNVPGLDIGSFYRAASQVGGDLYDVFPVGEGRHCLVVADVSGKGVPASLIMSVLRTVVRFKADGERSPARILQGIEDYLTVDIPAGVFITVALAIYDNANGELRYASAGHNPLIYYQSRQQEFSLVNPKGSPLGLGTLSETSGAGPRFAETSLMLQADDILCLYTDGLSELVNSSGDRLGPEGLASLLERVQHGAAESAPLAADNLVSGLVSELDSYRAGEDQDDDMTLVIGRIAPRVAV